MKSSLFLLAGVAASLSLASCSSNTPTETTSTTMPADTAGTAMTTRTYTDTDYHTRGDRMATKFASQNKISDDATLTKLKTAYYNRAKRYDEMMNKFKADTAGMGQARRDYMKANDQEFESVLVVPAQYQAYQSSYSSPDYDESSNLDTNGQSAAASSATMPSDNSGNMSSGSGNMSSGSGNMSSNDGSMSSGSNTQSGNDNMSSGGSMSNSNTPTTASKVMKQQGMIGPGNEVEKSKTKLENGAKVKVKDGDVKVKTADGEKMKM